MQEGSHVFVFMTNQSRTADLGGQGQPQQVNSKAIFDKAKSDSLKRLVQSFSIVSLIASVVFGLFLLILTIPAFVLAFKSKSNNLYRNYRISFHLNVIAMSILIVLLIVLAFILKFVWKINFP